MYQILVVEDQAPVREGICQMINAVFPQQFEITEAENGIVGCRLAREAFPDIILTDIMMPIMSGLEMIEDLRPEMPETTFVIMSAYEEFSYARRALELGVQEYLMKPITEKVLFVSIQKALGVIRDKGKNTYSDLVLYDYFSGVDISIEPLAVPKYAVLARMDKPLWAVAILERKTGGSQEQLLEFQIKLEFTLSHNGYQLVSFHNYQNRIAIFFNFKRNENSNFEVLVIEQLLHFSDSAFVGISECNADLKQLKALFRQAEYALNQAIYQSKPYETFEGEDRKFSGIVNRNICEHLLEAIKQNDKANTKKLMDQIFSDVSRLCTSKEMAQLEFERLSHYIELHLGLSDSQSQGFLDIREKMEKAKTMLSLKAAVGSYIDRLMVALSEESKAFPELQRVFRYVEENYGKDINAATLANISNMSYSYFCTYFSKNVGMTTSEYINDIRLKYARRLLESGADSITDIATQCGFSDYRYFSKLFKKKYDCNPTKYRKQ